MSEKIVGRRADVTVPDELEYNRVWAVFQSVSESERHFNQLENSYRTLASTWLLAALAATGFVLTNSKSSLPVDPLLLCALVCLLGIAGITMLWRLDFSVYHQLLDAWFEQGLRLESEYPWLPAVRTNMTRRMNNRGALPSVTWFYLVSDAVLITAGGIPFCVWAIRRGWLPGVLAGAIVLAMYVAVFIVLRRLTPHPPKLDG